MKEVAVRGFINEKFNTTFGKGLFRKAVFNGSVELRNPQQKYLVDYYSYANWEHSARTDDQMAAVRQLAEEQISKETDVLMSWIVHYDKETKVKCPVNGFSVYLPASKELYLQINDEQHQVQDDWTLNVQHCKSTGINKPVFIATNADLTAW